MLCPKIERASPELYINSCMKKAGHVGVHFSFPDEARMHVVWDYSDVEEFILVGTINHCLIGLEKRQ